MRAKVDRRWEVNKQDVMAVSRTPQIRGHGLSGRHRPVKDVEVRLQERVVGQKKTISAVARLVLNKDR